MNKLTKLLLIACASVIFPGIVKCQQINLDKLVKAGELTLFPDLSDQNKFYYLPDKISLATGENGKPQFSFLRYVENVRTGSTQEGLREGEGGGIVHAIVALDVSEDIKREAQRELQRKHPGAVIEGPVIYKSGRFGLVSSFKDENGELTKQVVGLGNAPLLEGHKAAISILLTKQGAKILWESFKMAAPDITFAFEMEIQGYREPKRATIEADFDQIYSSQNFQAGIATSFLAAEIKIAFDELVKTGAIKVEQVGADEKMESLITTAYNKLTEMMFTPINGTGAPSLSQLTSTQGGQASVLDRATQMLNKGNQGSTTSTGGNQASGGSSTNTSTGTSRDVATSSTTSTSEAQRAQQTTSEGRGNTATLTAAGGNNATSTSSGGTGNQTAVTGGSNTAGGTIGSNTSTSGNNRSTEASPGNQKQSSTNVAIVATFEMKKERRSGKFRIDLNKWTSDNQSLPFSENIGNLSQYMDDPLHFRQINLDDPLYRQREIVAFVDGYNATDFKKYINFISVRLHKIHESGELTDDEVRIDRYNFNDNGNYFKMLYGWKGDVNREKWMEYQYEVLWSFFGDNLIKQDLKSTTFNTINLSPPLVRRSVELQADETLLKDAGVRLATVNIYYKIGDKEFTEQGTLNPARGLLSEKIDFLTLQNDLNYEYEVSWRLPGNRVIRSGRLTSSESILFVDELPE